MNTVGTPILWGEFTVIASIMLIIDLFLQKTQGVQKVSAKQATIRSLVWVILSLFFCTIVWFSLLSKEGRIIADLQALSFLTSYLIEKALAFDNVFVWLVLFNYFTIPSYFQHYVLIYGILGAIILRIVIIFFGSWIVSQFKWLLYFFGILLLMTSIKIFFTKEKTINTSEKMLIQWLKNRFRITDVISDKCFFIKKNGLLYITPLFLVLILIELSDIIFALDSIPAIFSVTTDPFIILTSNLFAMLGLRSMYFLLVTATERIPIMRYGISLILLFIGIKMMIIDFYCIPTIISLCIIVILLLLTLVVNWFINNEC